MKFAKIALVVFGSTLLHGASNGAVAEYNSPLTVIGSVKGEKLYIAEVTGKKVAEVNISDKKVARRFDVTSEPMGLASDPKGKFLYVASGVANGVIQKFELSSGKSIAEIKVGHSPIAPQVSPDGKTLYVCNRFNNNVSFVDLVQNKEVATVPVTREPVATALSKDGSLLFVANHLPTGAANVDHMTSVIDIVDTASKKVVKSIPLPNGAIDLRGMCLSHDGEFVYVPSILARFLVPTTQIERGWINTHAMNIINVKERRLAYTVLLDDVDLGAANPWGITCTSDGRYIAVAHSATNEVSLIDRKALFEKLKKRPENKAKTLKEKEEYEALADNPANDLSFLTGIRQRVKLPGVGARGIVAVGNDVYVTQYFSGNLAVVKPGERVAVSEISLGEVPEMNKVRKGEMYFNDATLCFQQWQACSTCHPDVRTDAVNWDLLNDGIGNPKSTKSLLYTHFTPPVMITGVRDKAETAVRAGIKYIQFSVVEEEKAQSIDEYLKSLKAVPSPYLVDGKLSESAKRGSKIFYKAGCRDCHSGPYYSGGEKYDVGTADGMEEGREFDTPNLVESWRTAPYLYDGRAATLEDVFTRFNKENKHGDTKNLTEEELADLVMFVKSL